MASWCAICSHKLNQDYVYHRKQKVHKACKKNLLMKEQQKHEDAMAAEETKPDWNGSCDVCGMSPIVPLTGLCGPCTFGDADTAGGNW